MKSRRRVIATLACLLPAICFLLYHASLGPHPRTLRPAKPPYARSHMAKAMEVVEAEEEVLGGDGDIPEGAGAPAAERTSVGAGADVPVGEGTHTGEVVPIGGRAPDNVAPEEGDKTVIEVPDGENIEVPRDSEGVGSAGAGGDSNESEILNTDSDSSDKTDLSGNADGENGKASKDEKNRTDKETKVKQEKEKSEENKNSDKKSGTSKGKQLNQTISYDPNYDPYHHADGDKAEHDPYSQDYEGYTPSGFVEVVKSGVHQKPHFPKPARGGGNARATKYSREALKARAEKFEQDSAMGKFLKEQRRRVEHVAEVCPKLDSMAEVPRDWRGPPPDLLNLNSLILDRQNKITFCPVYKAASTSWTGTLLELGGYKRTKKVPLQKLVGQVYPKISNLAGPSLSRSTTKFMVVRHPLERLLSCYRDKFEYASKWYYYLRYGEKMVRRYRKFTVPDSHIPLLQDQVRQKVKAGLPVVLRDNPFAKPLGPTFSEFVQYVVESKRDDEHWRSYYKHCSSCHMEYDFILMFEKLYREGQQFIEYLNRTGQVKQRWDNPTGGGTTTLEIACTYYSQISVEVFEKVVKKYENDFKLYEYTPDVYRKCLKDKG